jgi:hypothetical protein
MSKIIFENCLYLPYQWKNQRSKTSGLQNHIANKWSALARFGS